MKIILGIITFNRKPYLEKLLISFENTYNKDYEYIIIIADDGSTDDTLEYLDIYIKKYPNIVLIKNYKAYIGGQTNSILQESLKYEYDVGFMVNDDVEFLEKGWDNDYVNVITKSNYHHLVYFDNKYASYKAQKEYKKFYKVKENRNLEIISKINFRLCMGCFWTFTKDVITKVGYFNVKNFNGSGYSHIEYTLRCCRAGFNNSDYLFDVINPKLKVLCGDNYISVKDNKNIINNKKALIQTILNKNFIYFCPSNI